MKSTVPILSEFLHPEIQEHLETLIVKRIGHSPDAYMITDCILSDLLPKRRYRFAKHGFEQVDVQTPLTAYDDQTEADIPYLTLTGEWCYQTSKDFALGEKNSNILGDNGALLLDLAEQKLSLPVISATQKALNVYGAQLVKWGDVISFPCSQPLPATVVRVGKDYVEDYLLVTDKGGGCYLEYHDRPHFHSPMDEQAGGCLILGKANIPRKTYQITGFRIPYGYGVLMHPSVLHADSYLIGKFIVVYHVAYHYSTVIMYNQNLQSCSFNLIPMSAKCNPPNEKP